MPNIRAYEYLPLANNSVPVDNTQDNDGSQPPLVTWDFRLVCILPGEGTARIEFDLQAFSIQISGNSCRLKSGTPRYETISYCWQGETRSQSIWHGDRPLLVSVVAHEMLVHLRRTDRSRWLWIDAICIDQSNAVERSRQVSIMRQIYSAAERTLVWLGPPTIDTPAAVQAIERLTEARADLGLEVDSNHRSIPPERRQQMMEKVDLPSSSSQDHALQSLANLLNKPYFERVWILQEIAVSNEIFVVQGTTNVAWHKFSESLALLYDLRMDSDWNEDMVLNIRLICLVDVLRKQIHAHHTPPLLALLNYYRHCKSTDPRDKIYALVGMSHLSHFAIPQYLSYTVTTARAYLVWTINMMETSLSLDVLSAATRYPKSAELEIYSWVPDWSFAGDTSNKHVTGGPDAHLQATKQSKLALTKANFRNEFTILGLRAQVIDRVDAVGIGLSERDVEFKQFSRKRPLHALRILHWLSRFWRDCESVARLHDRDRYVDTTESMIDAYWQTLSYASLGFTPEALRTGRAEFDAWYPYTRKLYLLGLGGGVHRFRALWMICFCFSLLHLVFFLLPAMKKQPVHYLAFEHRWTSGCGWRRLIRTTRGYIGLASHSVKVGDSIALVEGGRIPLTLRPSGQEWRLTGDAYVHGWMQGEKWEPDRCELFWIR